MAGIAGKLKGAAVAGGRWSIWFRLLALAQVALAAKRHLDLLEDSEKEELRRLVKKSKGRPTNLTRRERERLKVLVEKVEPRDLAAEAAEKFVPSAGRLINRK